MSNLKIVAITIAIFFAFSDEGFSQVKKAVKRPNVILIYSDDQGYADLNIYGSKDLFTPNLDKLAKKGTRFTQFYSASPICSPSRASLLTGRYPQRAGLAGNAGSIHGGNGMPGEQFTIAELFKQGGYQTAHIGKWHLGYSDETMPNAQGFDYSFGFMGGVIDNYSHFFYWGGPNQHDLWRNGKQIYESGKFFPDMMVDEAGKFMEERKSEIPFFIYFAINGPHYPLQPEKKWIDHYKDLEMPRKMYAAYVSSMDEKIGMLLQKIDELGLRENTIIIFQADQGHSEEERGFGGGGNSGPYRGSKFSVFEGGVRVPAFISWPGHIPVNEVRDQMVANIDWFPTLAEYCKLALPDRKIDGKSIVKVINSAKEKSPHSDFYWQSLGTKEAPQWAVRDGNWKLLHNPIEAKQNELNENKFMLINLKKDIGEKINLAAEHPDIVERLHTKYKSWIEEVVNQ